MVVGATEKMRKRRWTKGEGITIYISNTLYMTFEYRSYIKRNEVIRISEGKVGKQ
jgi:hypothetical protein